MIRAKSLLRTIMQNGREVPIVKDFSQELWNRLPAITTKEGEVLPKMGFVKIVGEGEVLVPDSAKRPAEPAKPKSEAEEPLNLEEHSLTINRIMSGKYDDLNAKEDLQPLAKVLGVKVNQIKSKLIEEIKAALDEKGLL